MPIEHHLKTPRSARYYTLGEDVRAPAEIWMVCHGYGQMAERFLARFAPVAGDRRLVVAPEGLSRFYVAGTGTPDSKVGASWMTREDRLNEIDDYIGYLDAVHAEVAGRADRKGAKLHVLGFSQGTATAARWAVRGRAPVQRLVLWAGLFPPEVDLVAEAARLNAMDVVLVAGEHDDPVMAGLGGQRAALDAAGVRYRLMTFAGDHALDEVTLRRLAVI